MIKQLRVPLAMAVLCAGVLLPYPTIGAGPRIGTGPSLEVVDAVNGRIAFSTGGILPNPDLSIHAQVFTTNPDGTGTQKLTHVPSGSHAGDPDWSPDSREIAYVSNVSGNFEIWVMNADGSGQHRLAGTPGWDYFTPRWSPDGSHLVFSRCNSTLGLTLYCDLAVMNADGTGRHILVGSHRFNIDPDYSPDGRRIVFDSDRAGLVSAIWVVNAAGGSLRRLTPPTMEAFWPQWSPDGEHILFSDNCCNPGASQVFEMRPNGTRVTQLTHLTGGPIAIFATYSPDGAQIVFASNLERPAAGLDLFTMNRDGSDLTRIVSVHPNVLLSDWGSYTSSTNDAAAR